MFDAFEGLFGLIIFVLDMVAIFDVVTGPKEAAKKVLWVVAILLLPVLGLILYYLIGKENLFSRMKHQ